MPYYEGWNDPLHEIIRKENKTCKGCIHQSTEKAFGIEVNFCKKGKKNMRKCDNYQDRLTGKKE